MHSDGDDKTLLNLFSRITYLDVNFSTLLLVQCTCSYNYEFYVQGHFYHNEITHSLTLALARFLVQIKIKRELDQFKRTEMVVHASSQNNTSYYYQTNERDTW